MFESNIKKLDEIYKKDPEYVDSNFNNFVNKMDYEVSKRKGENKDILDKFGITEDKDIFYIVLISILLLIYGAVMLLTTKPENFIMYAFGFIFFIAGFGIGVISKDGKGMGLVFYFSHGGSGLAVMIGSLLINRINEAMLTDLSGTLKIYMAVIVVLITFATLAGVIYNLSDGFRFNIYNKVYLFLVFAISIVLVGLIPYIH